MINYNRRKILITCWYKYNTRKDTYEYNHFEEGYPNTSYPLPFDNTYKNQKRWRHSKWKKIKGYKIKGSAFGKDIYKIIEEKYNVRQDISYNRSYH